MFSPLVKICGLTRRGDAERAAESGASYGGAILAPGGKRTITVAAAAALFAELPLLRVGVFVDATVEEMLRAAETVRLDVIQLHGSERAATAASLRDRGCTVWKAIRLRDPSQLADAVDEFDGAVDGLHVDGYSPLAPGGTGTSFDWDALAARLDRLPDSLPLIVSGGLTPENVARAVATLHPAVVDVSTGVETSPGVKDPAAVAAFVAAVRGSLSESII